MIIYFFVLAGNEKNRDSKPIRGNYRELKGGCLKEDSITAFPRASPKLYNPNYIIV